MPRFLIEPMPADELSPDHDPTTCTGCVLRELIYRVAGRSDNVYSDDPAVAQVMGEIAAAFAYFATGSRPELVEAAISTASRVYYTNGGDMEIVLAGFEPIEQGDVIPKMKN